VRAPDQQGHGREQIEQGEHMGPPVVVAPQRGKLTLPRDVLRSVLKL
jgi:hypothetical protein